MCIICIFIFSGMVGVGSVQSGPNKILVVDQARGAGQSPSLVASQFPPGLLM